MQALHSGLGQVITGMSTPRDALLAAEKTSNSGRNP